MLVKTVCYSMIVLAFNYHLSIITIMGKSDNVLYINILLNVRCVLKLIQNRLKRLVFFNEDKANFFGEKTT